MGETRDGVGVSEAAVAGTEASASFGVPEMDCPTCASKVERSLDDVEGVIEISLQPTTGTAAVTYDPERTTETAVAKAIEAAGYEVSEVSAADNTGAGDVDVAPSTAVWSSARAKKTWIGGVALVLGLAVEFLLPGLNLTLTSVLGAAVTVADLAFLFAIAVSGAPVVRGGYYSLRNRSLDIDLLMGTAILAATAIGFYVEAATLAVLFSVAELLEEYAMDRARDSLRELLALSPDEATVIRAGEEAVIPAETVEVGETVVVKPGEKIPLDGVVSTGESAVDQSPITGESVPVDKTTGDEVYAGAINEDGYLEIEVTSHSTESTLSRIIEMVQGAQADRTETEQFVDRFAGYYTPTIVVLAILTAVLPPLVIAEPVSVQVAGYPITFVGAWGTWFVRGLTLLVIACPCAFVISTPVSVVSGITSAAKNGVLVKGGSHLEAMGRIDAIALDKTGTLTAGDLSVTEVLPAGDVAQERVLTVAAALEGQSSHPIAAAILERVAATEQSLPTVDSFESLSGWGIKGEIDGEEVLVGKPELFVEAGFEDFAAALATENEEQATEVDEELADFARSLRALERDGKTVVVVSRGNSLLGAMAVADQIRPASPRAVRRLQALGVEQVVMLTGDNEATAAAIAEQVGVDGYRANLLPAEKLSAIESLQESYGEVAMVGDGINDAPALATADVGIAMGAAGTDTALETADIALMGDDVARLPYLYDLSNRATSVIKQNIWASLGIKALLAVGVPLGFVSVALAVVVGDMGMSLGVTGNAMRLARIVPERLG